MVEGSGTENNGYAMLEVMPDSSLRLQGFRSQAHRQLTHG
jgi:alkaline phosphatase